MLRKLYDRCVELARHKFSKPLLGFVAFIESFFFPVPPDLMIVPMVVAKRDDYLKIFLIATTGSVLGGLFGYMLGVFFLDASMVIIEFYGYEEKVFEMQDKMSTKGGFLAWLGIMFLAGFTPLPFKVSREKCNELCLGFAYAGVQYSEECFCGNSLPSEYLIAETNCNMKCAGNENQICGGVRAINVFSTIPF